MKMVLQRLRGTDWRYSITEVFLIFVGISLALLFDNWNEDRKQRALEAELLEALRSDLTEINFWLPKHRTETALHSQKKFLEALESDGPPPGTHEVYEAFFNQPSLIVSFSAYESLKNVGIDVVSDRGLRSLIIRLYEGELPMLDESEKRLKQWLLLRAWPYYAENFSPAENERLVWNEYIPGQVPSYENIVPIDWERMRQDGELKLLMINLYERRTWLLWNYTTLESEIDTLLSRLPEPFSVSE